MVSSKKIGWWLFIVLVFVAAGFGIRLWMQKHAALQYRTAPIERGAITGAVAASGNLSAVVSVQVGSQVSGQLKEVLVDFNSEVKKGQLMARIDPESFEFRVRQAQADLDAARAQVMTQEANVAAQRAEVARVEVSAAEAKRDVERRRKLLDKNFISPAELEKVEATWSALAQQVNTTRAQVAVAQAGVRNAEAVVRQREAALAQAKVDLERTAIRAPVNGIVIKRSVEKGQTVAASLQAPELFVIAENLTDMQVDAAIDESEIGRVAIGQKATFTVDAFPGRTYEGTVKQIRKAAQNVSNVVTYTVVINAANPEKELLPGMTANVRVVTAKREGVLKVPNAALRLRLPEDGDGKKSGPAMRPPSPPSPTNAQSDNLSATAANDKLLGTPGRIYLLDEHGQPKLVNIRLGLSDGVFSEILSADVNEGTQVITGLPRSSKDDKPAVPPPRRLF